MGSDAKTIYTNGPTDSEDYRGVRDGKKRIPTKTQAKASTLSAKKKGSEHICIFLPVLERQSKDYANQATSRRHFSWTNAKLIPRRMLTLEICGFALLTSWIVIGCQAGGHGGMMGQSGLNQLLNRFQQQQQSLQQSQQRRPPPRSTTRITTSTTTTAMPSPAPIIGRGESLVSNSAILP